MTQDVDDETTRREVARDLAASGDGTNLPQGALTGPAFEKVIVAIHGIGNQRRSDTIRAVARRFGDREEPKLPVHPLGYFHMGEQGEVMLSKLDVPDSSRLAKIGFAEIFWSDVPRDVDRRGDTLEEIKAWGRTVAGRAEAVYRCQQRGHEACTPSDFQHGAGVLDEIVETLGVMESLSVVSDKLGVFKFEAGPLMREYLGDVQVVTEFKFYRDQILTRFHHTMTKIVDKLVAAGKSPEIHIVAHSEGTVISFLALLQALSDSPPVGADPTVAPPSTGWVRHVRGFMTIGSPIDKHVVLWSRMWAGMKLSCVRVGDQVHFERKNGADLVLEQPIKWRNYYDYGDPIGDKVEAAREYLDEQKCQAFDFAAEHDYGFSRYWLPGKAHVDYWSDCDVFGHFIDSVVAPIAIAKATPRPADRPGRKLVSTSLPYLGSLVLHLAAVFVLFKGMTAFVAEKSGPAATHTLGRAGLIVVMFGLLMAGVTVAARTPRLVVVKGWSTDSMIWRLRTLALFAGLAAPTVMIPMLFSDDRSLAIESLSNLDAAWLFVLYAGVVASSGWLAPRVEGSGRKWLLGSGVLIVLVSVAARVGALLDSKTPMDAPIWPLLLSGAAFLYLWWLGILLFDLAFVWHRYIRRSIATTTLRKWRSSAAGKHATFHDHGHAPVPAE